MPSNKINPIWACKKKNTYKKEAAAIKAALWAIYKSGEDIRPYVCPFCSWWHIGHPTKRKP